MATEQHHRKPRGECQEVLRQRIPKVGHQDFTALLPVQSQYPVRMCYLHLLNTCDHFSIKLIYFISNIIHPCVYFRIIWHYNRFENEIISEAVRTDADTCKTIFYVFMFLFFIVY